MPAKLSPLFNDQTMTATGAPASGYKIYTYVAGSSTPLATYTDAAGTIPQANPVVLNSSGFPNSPIWLASGASYKFIEKDASDVVIRTLDGITGINDTTNTASQFQGSGVTPTYVTASSFTLPGDQTTEFHVGRRLQFTTTAGTVYGTISVSAYTTLTTITMTMDAANVLDSGLSAVNLSILRADKPSLPSVFDAGAGMVVTFPSGRPTIATTIYRGFLAGLALSTAGSSATMTIADGQATDNGNVYVMSLAAPISKTTAAWAVGSAAGGLDTGTIANSTGYHFYLIRRPDTGVVDVVFSTSASAPTLPTNYTQYRRIGWGRTNGSGQWTAFIQNGDTFLWKASVVDINTAALGTTPTNFTLTVPFGLRVQLLGDFAVYRATTGRFVNIYSPDITDEVASQFPSARGFGDSFSTVQDHGIQLPLPGYLMTNTSAQIRAVADAASTGFYVSTRGWIDTRGRG